MFSRVNSSLKNDKTNIEIAPVLALKTSYPLKREDNEKNEILTFSLKIFASPHSKFGDLSTLDVHLDPWFSDPSNVRCKIQLDGPIRENIIRCINIEMCIRMVLENW